LTSKYHFKLPEPPMMKNHENYIISLSDFVKWLGKQAEALGVEIYPGFAGNEVIYDERDKVIGIASNDVGVDKMGNKKVIRNKTRKNLLILLI
jgi:electron-transferring-flavoprotein dehydrogenase